MLIRMDGTYQLDLVLAIARAYTATGDAAAAERIVPDGQTIRTGWQIYKTNYTDRLNHYRHLTTYYARADRFKAAQRTIEELRKDELLGTPDQREKLVQDMQMVVVDHVIDYHLMRRDVDSALKEAAKLPARLQSGASPRDGAYKKILRTQWTWGEVQEVRRRLPMLTSSWNRNELIRELAELSANTGNTDDALDVCSLLTYPHTKVAALTRVASALAVEGNKNRAITVFREATVVAKTLQDFFRPQSHSQARALCDIARHQFPVDRDGALANIVAARSQMAPAVVLAATEAHCGLIDQASETCESIKSPHSKFQAYCEVAKACVRAECQEPTVNWLKLAAEQAGKVEGDWARENAILELVETCVGLNEMELAVEGVTKLKGIPNLRAQAMLAIVRGYASNQDIRRAKAVRDQMKAGHMRRKADQYLVNAKIKQEDLAGAFEIARKLDGTEFYETARTLIAAQLAARDYAGATLTAKTVHTVGPTDESLRKIAEARTRSGDAVGALAMVSTKNRGMVNAYVYLGIAEGLISSASTLQP